MIPIYYSYESFTINYELECFIMRTLTTTFGLVFHLGTAYFCFSMFLNLMTSMPLDNIAIDQFRLQGPRQRNFLVLLSIYLKECFKY